MINTGIFDDTEVIWLGRPPIGRDDGIWDGRLAVSVRELQKDTWQKLDTFKVQLKLVLEEVEKQVFERGKDWNYILDFLLNP